MQVRQLEQIAGEGVDPLIHPHLAATRAEAGLARKGDAKLILTIGTDVPGVTGFRATAKHHALDRLTHVRSLVSGNFVIEAQVAPPIPMVAKYLPKAVGVSWAISAKREASTI